MRPCGTGAFIRTCGLYGLWGSGGKGGNFVETMLRLASAAGKPVHVVSDQFCTPTFTQDLARAVVAPLEAKAEGLFHITSAGMLLVRVCRGDLRVGRAKAGTGPDQFQGVQRAGAAACLERVAGNRLAQMGLAPLRPCAKRWPSTWFCEPGRP